MLLFEGLLQIGRRRKKKSIFQQLRGGHKWQKFIKVFREVKAVLMQIMQQGWFNQLHADKGSAHTQVENKIQTRDAIKECKVYFFHKPS